MKLRKALRILRIARNLDNFYLSLNVIFWTINWRQFCAVTLTITVYKIQFLSFELKNVQNWCSVVWNLESEIFSPQNSYFKTFADIFSVEQQWYRCWWYCRYFSVKDKSISPWYVTWLLAHQLCHFKRCFLPTGSLVLNVFNEKYDRQLKLVLPIRIPYVQK